MAITPARLSFNARGIPCSEDFDDVYHSVAGALGQSEHVFQRGNGLPERWRGREQFTIIETGFGLGLNFLATWAAWRADPQRSRRLHFISCELHPFAAADLARLHARWPELAALSAALRAQWPSLTPGLHRLHFEHDRLSLTLYFGSAEQAFAQMVARADAFYLDGFSPAKNPQMWSARLCHLLVRCAADEATLATWSVAATVREHLRHAGFELHKAPGFGGKREMLCGRLRPRTARFVHPAAAFYPSALPSAREALIIGAGLAGCAAAERLAARGWQVRLVDAATQPAQGASGNLAGVLRPQPSLDDNPLSRLSRVATVYGWQHIRQLQHSGLAVQADACGVLHLARDAEQAERMAAVVKALALPAGELAWLDAAAASARAQWTLPHGGWYFAQSGWVRPPSLCAANLQRWPTAIETFFGQPVAQLKREHGQWQALAADGQRIAGAEVLILAAGVGCTQLAAPLISPAQLPIRSARGQVSHFPASASSAPPLVICGQGYLSPAIDGICCAGASFAIDDEDSSLRIQDHAENLARIEAMLPGYRATLGAAASRPELAGRVGFRPVAPDRLPLIGPLPQAEQAWLLGGYGARGLMWSQLGAELLASMLSGEALPVERRLVELVSSTRFSRGRS